MVLMQLTEVSDAPTVRKLNCVKWQPSYHALFMRSDLGNACSKKREEITGKIVRQICADIRVRQSSAS